MGYVSYATITPDSFSTNIGDGWIELSYTPDAAPSIGSINPTTTLINTWVLIQIPVTGYPTPTVTVTGLPPGLDYNSGTETITGMPTKTGSYLVVVTAVNVAGHMMQPFLITVNTPAPTQLQLHLPLPLPRRLWS